MYKCKNKWDYFCELLVAVPGLAAMFDDTRSDTPAEAAYKKSMEAEERLKSQGLLPSADRAFDDRPAREAGWEKGGSATEALVEGVKAVEDTVKEGLDGLRDFVRNHT